MMRKNGKMARMTMMMVMMKMMIYEASRPETVSGDKGCCVGRAVPLFVCGAMASEDQVLLHGTHRNQLRTSRLASHSVNTEVPSMVSSAVSLWKRRCCHCHLAKRRPHR